MYSNSIKLLDKYFHIGIHLSDLSVLYYANISLLVHVLLLLLHSSVLLLLAIPAHCRANINVYTGRVCFTIINKVCIGSILIFCLQKRLNCAILANPGKHYLGSDPVCQCNYKCEIIMVCLEDFVTSVRL